MRKQKTAIILAVLTGLSLSGSAFAADPVVTIDATPYANAGDTIRITGNIQNPRECTDALNTENATRWQISVDNVSQRIGVGESASVTYTTSKPEHTIKIYYVCGFVDNTTNQLTFDSSQRGWEERSVSKVIKQTTPTSGGGGPPPPGNNGCPPGQDGNPCKLINPAKGQLVDTDNFPQLLSDIIKILLSFAGVIGVIFLILGGYRYIASQGNEEGMEKAKKTIMGALIGIVLIILSFAVVAIINNLLVKGP